MPQLLLFNLRAGGAQEGKEPLKGGLQLFKCGLQVFSFVFELVPIKIKFACMPKKMPEFQIVL